MIRFTAPALIFLSLATFGSTISRAQDQQEQSVAEAARRERARKQESQKPSAHVYTEEDLKHRQILTPQDRSQVEAKRNECARKNNCSPAPSQNPPASLDANSQTSGTSLGDVARKYRKQKELQALKPKQTEPFHLPFSAPALASPILPERSAIRPPAQPLLRPKISSPRIPSNVFRRDPFSAVPVRPEIRRPQVGHPEISSSVGENVRPGVDADVRASAREKFFPVVRLNVRPDFTKEVRPILRAHSRTAVPALPRISQRRATPGILIQQVQPLAPAQPAKAVATVSTVRSVQPPALAMPMQPASPAGSIRPAQPKLAISSSSMAMQRTISIRPGDSLWKLAQQNLGRGNRWHRILAANPHIADPNFIRSGAQLNLPAVAASPVLGQSPNTGLRTRIRVRKGDTLWALAKSTLGHSSAWACLAAANPSLRDPNRIFEDQELQIPAVCGTELPSAVLQSSQNR
ncbi:MAG: LysM peptidoglycan-binding domain-containing protein [Candidatus Acidiferrum sp.]